jgi:F-type H+-transporting ATPase subunit b
MELFQALGLDIRILLAQFINFSVLVFVLYRFAYRPIFDVLEERRLKIEQGIRQSEEAEKELQNAKEKSKEILREAKKEAKMIVEDAQHKAQKRKEEVVKEAREEVKAMIAQHKKELLREKANLLEEIKRDVAHLIVRSVKTIMYKDVSEEDAKEMTDRMLREFIVKDK